MTSGPGVVSEIAARRRMNRATAVSAWREKRSAVASDLEIEVIPGNGVVEVVMRGEFDADNCSALAARVSFEPSSDVEIDMSAVSFIDSSAIREVLRLRERVAESGGSVRIPAVSPQVRMVLDITGLTGLLEVGSA